MKPVKLRELTYCLICPCGTIYNVAIAHSCEKARLAEGRLDLAVWDKEGKSSLSDFRTNPFLTNVYKPFGVTSEPDRQTMAIPTGCSKAH